MTDCISRVTSGYGGLHKNAAMILGLDNGCEPEEATVKLVLQNKKRQIREPYVCIAAQASSQAKYWNNGHGWINVVKYLKERGATGCCASTVRTCTA